MGWACHELYRPFSGPGMRWSGHGLGKPWTGPDVYLAGHGLGSQGVGSRHGLGFIWAVHTMDWVDHGLDWSWVELATV
jgi:hypothetical protein